MKILLSSLLVLLLVSCGGTDKPDNITPVQSFDAQRYLGNWYEIARLDHKFERGLSHVTAEYSLRNDGGIKVVNKGYSQKEGEWNTAEGRAYFVKDKNTGFLKVSFWGPFYSSYVVFELDSNYQYALVSGENKKYFWILSRQPQMEEAQYNQLVEKARALGFDTTKLVKVDHSIIATEQLTRN